ncbi:MAG TPA: 50S ribosomal protein L10 [Candidatus Saccharimonadales bacterium]|nr:50S ribosomal protein L10 [Candidatus Saccharimonadales bacterium]
MLTRQVAAWKKEIYSDLVELLQKYSVVAVADLQKVRSSQIQEIRKKLRGKAELIVAKNTILRKASEQLATEKPNVDQFADTLTGSKVLIFTQMNPYELIIFLNKNKVRVPAKGGDVATGEIMVQAGNTGLQPGPIISEFNEAKVQTRIEGGSIFVAKDTIVARKGDVISTKAASLMSKLGMKPMEAGLSIACAYDHGLVLRPTDLTFDLDQMKTEFSTAVRLAFGVAVEAVIMLPATAPQIISKAYRQAMAVSMEAGFLTKQTTPFIIQRAVATMNSLSSAISSKNPEALSAGKTSSPPPEGKG